MVPGGTAFPGIGSALVAEEMVWTLRGSLPDGARLAISAYSRSVGSAHQLNPIVESLGTSRAVSGMQNQVRAVYGIGEIICGVEMTGPEARSNGLQECPIP